MNKVFRVSGKVDNGGTLLRTVLTCATPTNRRDISTALLPVNSIINSPVLHNLRTKPTVLAKHRAYRALLEFLPPLSTLATIKNTKTQTKPKQLISPGSISPIHPKQSILQKKGLRPSVQKKQKAKRIEKKRGKK